MRGFKPDIYVDRGIFCAIMQKFIMFKLICFKVLRSSEMNAQNFCMYEDLLYLIETDSYW